MKFQKLGKTITLHVLCRLPLKDPWSQSSDSDLPQPRPRACLLLLYSIRKSQASSLIGPGSRDTRLLAPSLAQSHTTAPCHVHQWEQPFCLWTYDASRWMKTSFFLSNHKFSDQWTSAASFSLIVGCKKNSESHLSSSSSSFTFQLSIQPLFTIY